VMGKVIKAIATAAKTRSAIFTASICTVRSNYS